MKARGATVLLVDGRHLALVGLCKHGRHRHIGTVGARCRICSAMWCTVRAYDCEVKHW